MSQMLAEMLQQPELLRENAENLLRQAERAAPKLKPQLVVFAARGSSDNACLYARYLFEVHLKTPALLAAPSVVTRYKVNVAYPPSLFIGLSQSGAAPDVAEVLAHARTQGHATIAITNSSKGAVVSAAEQHIELNAGEERAVAATKTYSLSLLALYQLVRALGGGLPAPDVADYVQQALDEPLASDYGRTLARCRLPLALGRGYTFSSAMEAALKLMECALVPCRAFSTADFAHGPIALAGPGTAALVFGQAPLDATSQQIQDNLEATGATCLPAPEWRGLPEELRPLPAAAFAQKVAYHAARARRLDPDRPRHISKVTRTM